MSSAAELATETETESEIAARICSVFDRCFSAREGLNTRLCGGHPEPFYRPAGQACAYHRVEFTLDYPASALHEAAHWCVAGAARRQQPDYGYWYAPDGRTAEQQRLFERVEVKPQALEWIFSRACGLRFRVSADNLAQGLGPSDAFRTAIFEQVRDYCRRGLPDRAGQFATALASEFGRPQPFCGRLYQLADLS
ncbi:elongation factor P hydroxylase [Microbulbifer guangxiensis]|uniref:elongation factor P hydroxylase n=1 Tax=Microbulbifer guangxiensis TaxID=2904249 RepID=UPI003F6F37D2